MAISESVKDETLDTAQVEIYFDDSKTPYPPRTLCRIMTDYSQSGTATTKDEYYHIATDTVGIQTIKPRTYKHTITLVQTTRKLSHYILPNMVITKPREAVLKTYFCNENALNLLFYDHSYVHSGPYMWRGFTTRYVVDIGTDNFRKDTPSPYWGECVPVPKHTKIASGVIKVHFDAIIASGTYSSGSVTATAKFSRLARSIAHPDWLTPYLQVYWCQGNINTARSDNGITKTIIEKVELDDLDWNGEFGYCKLSNDAITKINAYTSGYLMCELISEVTGTVPTELYYEAGSAYVSSAYDRLFCDYTEFLYNNIQTIWSNVSLELSYKQDTLYEVLERIIKRQQCKYDGSTNDPLFYLPTSGDDYTTLIGTEAPEFSFVNLTVFEAVSKVLETIDALPRFDCDDEGKLTLGLDYFASTGAEIAQDQKFTSYTSSATEQKRDNGILTNFQGAEMLCHFPCPPRAGVPCTARARVASYGIPTASDFVLAVDKPIKYINHLWVANSLKYQVAVLKEYLDYKVDDTTTIKVPRYTYSTAKSVNTYVDLASFVFDDTTYSSALAQVGAYTNSYTKNARSQFNCLKFKKGSKNIEIGVKRTNAWNEAYWTFWNCLDAACNRAVGAYAQNYDFGGTAASITKSVIYDFATLATASFKDIWFSCEYGSDIDGRLEIQSPYAKEEGQFLASANSTSPDLSKLGLNMLGVTLRSGEPTMTCTQVLSDWNSCLRVGQVYRENDETWVVTKASYSTLTTGKNNAGNKVDVIKGTIELTKNFNGLAKRIGIDQSKRLYNIDRNISALCEMNITHYLYFEPHSASDASVGDTDADTLPLSAENIGRIILKAFSHETSSSNAFTWAIYQEVGQAYVLDENGTAVFIPLSVYGAGNCLCFEAKFDDPISAGIRMDTSASGTTYWWATSTYQKLFTGSTYYYGTDVKYTDNEGYKQKVTVYYRANDGTINGNEMRSEYPKSDFIIGGKTMGKIANIEFDKQPNEIFGLNYELAFLSKYHTQTNEVFFGRRFFQVWGGSRPKDFNRLYFSYSKTDKYNAGSQRSLGSRLLLRYCYLGISGSASSQYGSIAPYLLAPYAGYTIPEFGISCWGICDENGDLLVGCNCDPDTYKMKFETGKAISLPSLHFFPKLKRI